MTARHGVGDYDVRITTGMNTNRFRSATLSSQRLLQLCISAPWILSLLILTLPAVGEAQFTYTTNNGTITITGTMM